MFDADDLATRLTHRDITPARLRKLKRLIDSDQHREDVIAAVEQKTNPETAQQVREALA